VNTDNFNKKSKYKMCVFMRESEMKEPPYILEELLLGKVYKKGKGLLSIFIFLCIQRYVYIIQICTLFQYRRNCIGPNCDYDSVVWKNEVTTLLHNFTEHSLVCMHYTRLLPT
jgi:hypothetical protein